MKSIAIYCGSSKGTHPVYAETARSVGRLLANKNIEIIYGAGNVGLMGEVAEAAIAAEGSVVGVIPEFMKAYEVCHTNLPELITTDTMHQRKQVMVDHSDGFIALPGGFGTLDELFEILTWQQLQLHQKPVGILNTNGFYDHLLAHIQHLVEEGFLKEANQKAIYIAADIETLLEQMSQHKAVAEDKWLG